VAGALFLKGRITFPIPGSWQRWRQALFWRSLRFRSSAQSDWPYCGFVPASSRGPSWRSIFRSCLCRWPSSCGLTGTPNEQRTPTFSASWRVARYQDGGRRLLFLVATDLCMVLIDATRITLCLGAVGLKPIYAEGLIVVPLSNILGVASMAPGGLGVKEFIMDLWEASWGSISLESYSLQPLIG